MPEIKTKETVQKQKPKLKPPQQWETKARRVYQFRKAAARTRQPEEQTGNEHETATEYATSMTEQATQEVVYELGRIPHGASAAFRRHQIKNRYVQQDQQPMTDQDNDYFSQRPVPHSEKQPSAQSFHTKPDDIPGSTIECAAPHGSPQTARGKGPQRFSLKESLTANRSQVVNSPSTLVVVPQDTPSFQLQVRPAIKQAAIPHRNEKASLSVKRYPAIREGPKGNPAPKQKPDIDLKIGTNSYLPVQKKSEQMVRLSVGNNASVTHRATELGRRRFIQSTQRRMAQQIPQAAKTTAGFAKNTVIAVAKSAQSTVGLLAGVISGTVLAAVFLLVILIGTLAASPFGIFFSNEPYQDSIPLNAAVSQINIDFSDRLDTLQEGNYDNITTTGNPPDWREVVAVYASKTAGADDGVDVATFDAERVERLRTVFWDMCSVSSFIETIEHPDSDPEDEVDDSWSEQNLYITISARTADEMRTAYAFTEYQNKALDELLSEMTTLNYLLGDLSISQGDAIALLQNLPADLSAERRTVVQHALSLVGKVNYFWGGKSLVLGWDSRWGQIELVWAAGSRTTGTYRPYGLDCSGFVDWVFYNASGGSYVIGHGGGAGAQHRYCTNISWSEAQPGDLVFYSNDDHVGVVGGRDPAGNLLIIHCASSQNNVVITGISGFISVARPLYYME